jgi:hypothetical protein
MTGPSPEYTEMLIRFLLSTSEGMCPEHRIGLRETGWCVRCKFWWRPDFVARSVTVVYPVPELGVYPEPGDS